MIPIDLIVWQSSSNISWLFFVQTLVSPSFMNIFLRCKIVISIYNKCTEQSRTKRMKLIWNEWRNACNLSHRIQHVKQCYDASNKWTNLTVSQSMDCVKWNRNVENVVVWLFKVFSWFERCVKCGSKCRNHYEQMVTIQVNWNSKNRAEECWSHKSSDVLHHHST